MALEKPLVLLTGATGFVGAHVLDLLLDGGKYRVLATVRTPAQLNLFERRYGPQLDSGDLMFATIEDLCADNALDSVLRNEADPVTYIMHLAFPFLDTPDKSVEDLVNTAVRATHNVMQSSLTYGVPYLKRLVLLSSFAAVVDLAEKSRPGYTYTAEDWNPITLHEATENRALAYSASRTFAELEAWKMHGFNTRSRCCRRVEFDLATLCPPMIYGPPIHCQPEESPSKGLLSLNSSTVKLVNAVTGRDPQFAPDVATPALPAWIDVRDVARALVASLELKSGDDQRILLCGGVNYFEDGLKLLRADIDSELGDTGAICDPANYFDIDRSKMRDLLGVTETIPFAQTVQDTYQAAKGLVLV